MEITVRLLASYRRYLPASHDAQAGYQLVVEPGACISDILATLPIPEDDAYTYLVNGRHVARDRRLEDGDVLSVFPAVGGG